MTFEEMFIELIKGKRLYITNRMMFPSHHRREWYVCKSKEGEWISISMLNRTDVLKKLKDFYSKVELV